MFVTQVPTRYRLKSALSRKGRKGREARLRHVVMFTFYFKVLAVSRVFPHIVALLPRQCGQKSSSAQPVTAFTRANCIDRNSQGSPRQTLPLAPGCRARVSRVAVREAAVTPALSLLW